MQFQILGPLEARNERGAVALGGIKPRAVLAVLLLHANEPVSAERLALALWGEEAPTGAVKTVRVHVSRLRRALGDADILTTTAAGYCLRVGPGELDAERFERLVDDGRRALADGQPEHAAAGLREALALWRGPPLTELAFEPFAAAEIARLEERRLAALEVRIEADLAVGQHTEVVCELQQIVEQHPRRERFVGQLMLALYRCGRQVEALDAYRDARRVLIEEIGVEPGPELRRLQEAILLQDPTLELRAVAAELPPELDASAAPPLVGRREELARLRLHWERAREGRGGVVTLTGTSGSGKLRLAAELAASVHEGGAAALYTSGSGPSDAFVTALRRTRQATRPTLLVIHAANRAGAAELAELEALSQASKDLPVLVIACCEDAEALARLHSDGVLALEALDVAAVEAIARQYARGVAADDVPTDWLLEASGGVPRAVHELASQWARHEATRYVGAVAGRAVAGREQLRAIQVELTGGVEDLQEVRDRITPRRWDAPVVCPFKGLASFDVVDAQYFFGRERVVAELVARLVGSQLLGIVGPSGSGKSSVMRAGLLPALASGVLPGSHEWAQVLLRPGQHPLRELGEGLARVCDEPRIVIAVDQFEETFTTCEDEAERAEFIAELGAAVADRRQRYVVVMALRADFYGRCAAYQVLADQLAANNVLVGPMQRDELRRAIELPARRAGLRVDSELADALVADVKDEPGALPLLSTALLELWQRRDGRRLRYTVYEQTGGVRGAVARLAEDAFEQLDGEQQVLARGVLMRLAGEGAAGGVERRRVALTELETDRNEDVARVVALLTDRRLLTVSSGTIELAHEALLREWPRLRDWIDADREGLRIHRNLNAAAREWDELGRDDGALYRGVRLTEAIEWNEAQQPRLNEAERAFLQASEVARQRDRAQRRRRIALAFGSLTVALLAISIVAVVSIVQGRRTASRELANRSQAVLTGDPALALAIGLEAVKRHDTPEARYAVRQATLADRATAVIRAHPTAVYRVALSPDGSRIATAGDDGLVRILSVDATRVISTIKGHTAPAALDVSFSPDGKQVASVGLDGDVAITDLDGGRRRVVLRLGGVPGPYARSVEYDPSGRRLLMAVTDGTVRLFRIADSQLSTVARHEGVRVARFDHDGRRVLSAGEDGYARLWSVAGDATASLAHKGIDIWDASFSPNSQSVATAGGDGALRIWSALTGRLLRKIALDLQPLYSVQFSADGRRVVTGGADGVVRVSDVRGGPVIAELKGHRDRVYDAAFLGSGEDRVYSTGTDGTVRLWKLLKTATLPVTNADAPSAASFSSDGKLVVSGYYGGEVRLWDPATDSQRTLPGYKAESAAVYSANGAYILSWTATYGEASARLYDVRRGTSSFARVPAHSEVYAAAIDPSGGRIARAGLAKPAVIQAPDGTHRRILPDHGQVNALAFSPNGEHLASASSDGTVHIWNGARGTSERVLKRFEGAALAAVYSPDGSHVAAAGADGTIRIWRLAGGDPIVLYGHDGPVTTLGFNPEGDRLVSGGKDGTVRIWDAAGEALVVLHTHEGEVSGVAFSPDGRQVVSSANDGLRMSACEVCGTFRDAVALARIRPRVTLTPAERTWLVAGGGS
jgi:WD40 repeat protein/DNA-binding SARP family transcriptional activator